MEEQASYYSPSTLHVCIDRISEVSMEGRIYCRMIKEPLHFVDIGQILLKADQMFDHKKYPQSFQDKRSFFKNEKQEERGSYARPVTVLSEEEIAREKGLERTIDVIVHSRCHASWQGVLRNEQGQNCGCFEGEIELLKCLARETGSPYEIYNKKMGLEEL